MEILISQMLVPTTSLAGMTVTSKDQRTGWGQIEMHSTVNKARLPEHVK